MKAKKRKKRLVGWTHEDWKYYFLIPDTSLKEFVYPRIFKNKGNGWIYDTKATKVRITIEEL